MRYYLRRWTLLVGGIAGITALTLTDARRRVRQALLATGQASAKQVLGDLTAGLYLRLRLRRWANGPSSADYGYRASLARAGRGVPAVLRDAPLASERIPASFATTLPGSPS